MLNKVLSVVICLGALTTSSSMAMFAEEGRTYRSATHKSTPPVIYYSVPMKATQEVVYLGGSKVAAPANNDSGSYVKNAHLAFYPGRPVHGASTDSNSGTYRRQEPSSISFSRFSTSEDPRFNQYLPGRLYASAPSNPQEDDSSDEQSFDEAE